MNLGVTRPQGYAASVEIRGQRGGRAEFFAPQVCIIFGATGNSKGAKRGSFRINPWALTVLTRGSLAGARGARVRFFPVSVLWPVREVGGPQGPLGAEYVSGLPQNNRLSQFRGRR